MKQLAIPPSLHLRVPPLVLVVLVVLGLAAVWVSWRSYLDARAEAVRAELDAVGFARHAAVHQRALLEQTSHLLRVLGGISLPETRDPVACRNFLARQLEHFAAYENLAFLYADGRVQCSAHALASVVAIPDANRPVATTEEKPLLLSFLSGRVAAILAREIADTQDGRTIAAVMPLREFLFGHAEPLPHEAEFAIVDGTGRLLASYPPRADWSSPDPLFGQYLLNLDFGMATQLPESPGDRRLYVAQALPDTVQALRLVIRFPGDAAAALSRQAMLLVTALALSAFALWLLSRVTVQRAVAALRRVDWKQLREKHPWQPLSAVLRARANALPLHRRPRAPGETTVLRVAYEDLKRAFADKEARMRQITLLDELSRNLQACQNMADLAQAVAHCAETLFPGSNGALLQRTAPDRVETVLAWGTTSPSEERITLPLMASHESLGILNLGGIDDYDPWASTSLAERAAAGMSAIKRQEQLRSRAMRDALTGLYNRRFMEEALTIEQRRALRRGTSIGVLIMDIDHFKRFNDTHGHDAGDILLRGMGALLRRAVREGDMPCRYGGEEFVVILPGADLAGTRQRAEALRAAIAQWNPQRDGQPLGPVTVSIGVAALPLHGGAWQKVLKAADQALYAAKRAGRNQVTSAPLH